MMMKSIVVVFVSLGGLAMAALLEGNDYRAKTDQVHERLNNLEIARADYRKPKMELSPEGEKERFELIGQLMEEDPLWALLRDMEADVVAMISDRTLGKADLELLDQMKELLGVVAGAVETPASRKESAEFATTLRKFVVRRDLEGARLWVKEHRK